jgi:hypothetical protein
MLARVIQAVFAASYAALIPAHKNAWVIFQMFGQCCCTWITSLAYIASGLFVPQEELGSINQSHRYFLQRGRQPGQCHFYYNRKLHS